MIASSGENSVSPDSVMDFLLFKQIIIDLNLCDSEIRMCNFQGFSFVRIKFRVTQYQHLFSHLKAYGHRFVLVSIPILKWLNWLLYRMKP